MSVSAESAALASAWRIFGAGAAVAGGDQLVQERLRARRAIAFRAGLRARRGGTTTSPLVSVIACSRAVLLAQRDGLAGLVAEGRADIGETAGRHLLLRLHQLRLQLHQRQPRVPRRWRWWR